MQGEGIVIRVRCLLHQIDLLRFVMGDADLATLRMWPVIARLHIDHGRGDSGIRLAVAGDETEAVRTHIAVVGTVGIRAVLIEDQIAMLWRADNAIAQRGAGQGESSEAS
ncbi:hypothetical protein D7S89_04550 [Trinickia fusca]|uniref:Uncharacterized protein n=1 Tax=Trinickia fusca TaxID=2419777 RepID=A0A494XQ43_9BURK|nr:hypothetical protein D7S89_04550 [Trinickia fusca]